MSPVSFRRRLFARIHTAGFCIPPVRTSRTGRPAQARPPACFCPVSKVTSTAPHWYSCWTTGASARRPRESASCHLHGPESGRSKGARCFACLSSLAGSQENQKTSVTDGDGGTAASAPLQVSVSLPCLQCVPRTCPRVLGASCFDRPPCWTDMQQGCLHRTVSLCCKQITRDAFTDIRKEIAAKYLDCTRANTTTHFIPDQGKEHIHYKNTKARHSTRVSWPRRVETA